MITFFSQKPDKLAPRGSQQIVAKITLDGVGDPGQHTPIPTTPYCLELSKFPDEYPGLCF